MLVKRIFREGTDDKKAAPAGDGGKKADTKDPEAAKLEEITKENERLKANEDKRAKEQADKEAADAVEKARKEGKLETELTETQKRLKAAQEENERLVKSAQLRTEAALAKLPKERQESLQKYKSKVALDVWSEMVEEAAASGAAGDKDGKGKIITPPPSGSPTKDRTMEDGYEPTERAQEILDQMGKSSDHLRKLTVSKDHDGSAWRFEKQMKDFVGDMKQRAFGKLTNTEADKRKT